MNPIIGIVGKSDHSYKDKSTICVFDNYRKAILEYGGIPIMILPPQIVDYEKSSGKEIGHLTDEDKNILNAQLKLCDGILIQGGPKAYEYDKYICEYANKFNIPLLGICMGMQTMCNYNNDNKNILNDNLIHKSEDLKDIHEVILNKNSFLYSIIKKERFLVNSNHNYHVPNSGSYKIAGISFDNLIEAVEKENGFNIGVQWHPEKQYKSEISKAIFKAFVNAAKKGK